MTTDADADGSPVEAPLVVPPTRFLQAGNPRAVKARHKETTAAAAAAAATASTAPNGLTSTARRRSLTSKAERNCNVGAVRKPDHLEGRPMEPRWRRRRSSALSFKHRHRHAHLNTAFCPPRRCLLATETEERGISATHFLGHRLKTVLSLSLSL